MSWYLLCLRRYAQFSGRARRKEYWYFVLFNMLVQLPLILMDVAFGWFNEEAGIGILSGLYTVAVLVPTVTVTVRRLHDMARSGWWLLLMLVPLLNLLLLIWLCLDGTEGDNAYGVDPKADAANADGSRPRSRLLQAVLIVILLPVAGLYLFGATFTGLAMTGHIPGTEVLYGSSIPERAIAELREAGIVEPDESVEFLYGEGLTSWLEGGSIITDQRVIGYYTEAEGERVLLSYRFEEIELIEQEDMGGGLEDASYVVWSFYSDDGIRLFLPRENRGDEQFVRALRHRVKSMAAPLDE